jgi:hypothetical protein
MDQLTQLLRKQSALISDLEFAAADIQQKLKLAQAKMDGLEAAATAVGQNSSLPNLIRIIPQAENGTDTKPIQSSQFVLTQESNKSHFSDGRKKRPLQDQWKNILQYIGMTDGAKLYQISEKYPDIKRKNIGSQLNYYGRQGYVLLDEGTGTYSLTDSGKVACGLPK